ncbi:MAG: cupredoxin domain-containing protein [Gammaproteobacteria bacterium]
MNLRIPLLVLISALTFSVTARASAPVTMQLVIKNRVFTQTNLVLPANTKVKLIVKNEDLIPAEFESTDLSREVVVPGHTSVVIYIDPLSPGKYNFFNDFNHAAQGSVLVNAPESAKTSSPK